MKWLLLALVGAVALVAITVGFKLLNPCKKPSELMTQIVMTECLLDAPQLRRDACQELKGSSDCSFEPSDLPAIKEFIKKFEVKCTKQKLEEKNYCSDKVEDIVRGQ